MVDLVMTLLGCGLPAWEIGIVTPYRAQGREIRSLSRQFCPTLKCGGRSSSTPSSGCKVRNGT